MMCISALPPFCLIKDVCREWKKQEMELLCQAVFNLSCWQMFCICICSIFDIFLFVFLCTEPCLLTIPVDFFLQFFLPSELQFHIVPIDSSLAIQQFMLSLFIAFCFSFLSF